MRYCNPENGGRHISVVEVGTPYGEYYRLQVYEGWKRYDTLDEAVEAEEWMES